MDQSNVKRLLMCLRMVKVYISGDYIVTMYVHELLGGGGIIFTPLSTKQCVSVDHFPQ